MSISHFIKGESAPVSAGDTAFYVENDPAIRRPATLGLLDFSNELCYAGTTPAPAYTPFLNLVKGGTAATNGPVPRAINGGMLFFSDTAPNTSAYVLLPTAEFSLPPTCKRALASVAVVLPAAGYGTLPANRYPMFFGRLNNTAAVNINFGLWGIVNTSGTLTSVQGAALGSNALSATAALSTLTDGGIHVVSIYSDGESMPGKLVSSIYVDKVLVAQATNAAWDGVVPQPTNLPRLGSYPATMHSPWGGMKVGRPLIFDLTGSALTADYVIAQQVSSTAAFLG
jgi:hypothetical protein